MFFQKLSSYARKHPKTLLVFLVVITACVAYHPYIFGKSVFLFTDIGSDTTEQYIMQYSSIVNHIRNGNFSLWDFTNGFGTSMYQLNLFHPLLWLLYLPGILLGPQVMPGCLIYVHILTLLLAALAVWGFLSCFSLSQTSRILASYIYAFNGFLTVWGQHYQFSAILVWLPLVLMVTEKALRKRRFSPWIPVSTALMVLSSYYLSYMALLTLAVYVALRLLVLQKGQGIRLYFRSLIRQGLAFLLGVGMGLVNLLPSFFLVYRVSSRLDSDMSLGEKLVHYFAPYSSDYYKTLARKLLSSNLEGIGSASSPYSGYLNYYEAPNLFFSTLFVFLLVQFLIYFFRNPRGRREKLVTLLALAGGAFSLLIMDGSLVFNAFSYPFSRHTFLLMPFFALVTGLALDRILAERRICLAGLLLSAVLTLGIYLIAAKRASTLTFFCNAVVLLITGLGMAGCLLIYARTKKGKIRRLSVSLLTLLLAGNLACDTWTTVSGRDSIQRGSAYFENLYGKDTQALSAWLQETDTSFYRLEKDYSAGSQCMDSLGQYYRGISTYNSTENKNILEFADKVLPSLYYINNAHLSFRQIATDTDMAALLGVKYLVSASPSLEGEGYRLLQSFGSLYLYENTDYTSFASFYTQTLSPEAYEAAAASLPLDTGKLLSQYVILNDERVESSASPAEITALASSPDSQTDLSASASQAVLTMEDTGCDSRLICQAELGQDGLLFFPIPYEEGWTATVNGEETQLLRADYGFTALRVSAGSQTVELTYHAPLFREGLLLTLTSWFILLLIILPLRRRRSVPAKPLCTCGLSKRRRT